MILLGSAVNAAAIIVCGIIGSFLKKGLPKRFGDLVIAALGFFTLMLGVNFAMKTEYPLVVIFSLVIGAGLGEWIDIEKRMDNIGNMVQDRLKGFKGDFSKGFVTASLLFVVGSMAIMGSLQSGLTNDHQTLYTKAVMDGVISIVFASTMGIGVAASALPVFIYQGTIALLAAFLQPYLSTAVVLEMTAVGGILLMGVGCNILEIKRVRVGNLIPAIFLPILIMMFI
ncbi:MAG: hypothetical protein A2Y23_01535 [Clostridiales bacterium GWB2_37_7]|nr:MAG: hypothetical protein A2Y23_01535 [Clostridiales bacterium GWB2_37_7]